MADSPSEAGFIVWGADQTPYGPVDISTLVDWAKDERVTTQSWVFLSHIGVWKRANELTELKTVFSGLNPCLPTERPVLGGLKPDALRRIKVLAGMTDDQLERFAQFIEVERVAAQSVVVRQGEWEDTICFISEGEMRVRTEVMGRELILARLRAGDCFGDLAFLDHGPRSADVVADTDATIFKVSGAAFDELARSCFDLATPVLRALDQTLTARIRADNERFGDALKHAQAAP